MKTKKGQGTAISTIGGLLGAAVLLVALAITLGVGSDILTDIQSDQTVNSSSYNATQGGLEGLDKIAGFQDTIGLVVVAAGIIAIVLSAFAFAVTRRR